jgi:Glycosyl hydrolase family 57
MVTAFLTLPPAPMNAPLFNQDVHTHNGWLRVFAFFHANLAFSSIDEERRAEVVASCYWPLLNLAERHPHLGIEVSGYTLEEIARIDPSWIVRARQLIAENKIELIGSGYSQMIGPLVPARVMAENLRLGNEVYQALLSARPAVALVNEQAFSAGIVGHYMDAGYRALLMDWDNPSADHPEWDAELQYLPQYASGLDGQRIALLWTNTAAFQQMQRFVYDDISLETYLRFVRSRRAFSTRALCLYASDAEIFDFRPGRFRTEVKLPEASEWERLSKALAAVTSEPGINLIGPSHTLKLINREGGGNQLQLESAHCPVPVKKQRKYNLARWAVTGRDNIAVNAACERIYRGMEAKDASDMAWKELCYLWASDFRTHLTEKRWNAFCTRLETAEAEWSAPAPGIVASPHIEPSAERKLNIETPTISARLDRRRGLALERLRFENNAHAIIGSLPHGYFEEIALQADWYTGDCVFEAPGEHKVTDLEWCEARIQKLADGGVIAHAMTDTPKGVIEKQMHFSGSVRRIDFDITFHWQDWGKGVLRLGHFTLLPDAFSLDRLRLATTNSGGRETFSLAGRTIDHGAPVSFLVSSSHGLGMTEGWVEIGDDRSRVRIEVDRSTAPLLGLLTHRPSKRSDGAASLFCQLQLSAMELDDTRKPTPYRVGPRRFRFSISAL